MRIRSASVLVLLAAGSIASAHPGHGEIGFIPGITHPLAGLDHLLAMVAVGLLAVRCAAGGDRRALWQVPAAFLAAMTAGGLLAAAGLPLPLAEWGIALSVLVFGVLIALTTVPRTGIAVLVVAAFAVLHGHAHVAEMAAGTHLAAYVGGFLLATTALHAVGVALGWSLARALDQGVVRVAGLGIAAASTVLFVGLLAG